MDNNEGMVKILQSISGTNLEKLDKYDIYNKIIGFKGVKDGVGCSTIVSNLAVKLAGLGLNVCVIDTSYLYPSQLYLLNAELGEYNKDWLDFSTTDDTGYILRTSKINSNIKILGFVNRNINDLVSSYDCEELIVQAYRSLENLYDIILVDICGETTNVCIAAAIHAHKIIQVWSSDFTLLPNIDSFMRNMKYCCCNLDKMRNVIIGKSIDMSKDEWFSVAKKFNLNILAIFKNSEEFLKLASRGSLLDNMKTSDSEINEIDFEYKSIINEIIKESYKMEEVEKVVIENKVTNNTIETNIENKFISEENTVIEDEAVKKKHKLFGRK